MVCQFEEENVFNSNSGFISIKAKIDCQWFAQIAFKKKRKNWGITLLRINSIENFDESIHQLSFLLKKDFDFILIFHRTVM